MRHKTTEAVLQYFNALRADRAAPLRSEIDPVALKSVLPDLFILEKARDGVVRFRLAGTRVCLILGREMRDRPFTDIWDAAARHRMRLAADTVIANRSVLEIAVTATDGGHQALALEMLMLPLFSRADQCDRIFGSLVTRESVAPIEDRVRLLKPADLAFEPVINAPRPLADALSPRGPASHGLGSLVNRVAHLRVFEGGRRD